ncbi:hypothetical protein O4H61_03370 [Roseovarius aestuarii]|nr:hypothetical protein [Roseovarius aestuarii]
MGADQTDRVETAEGAGPETSAAPDPKPETKRDRVRRLFIRPMTDWGWRKPGDMKADAFEAMLVKLCDDLAYLSDRGFSRLRDALRTKGTGKGLNGWPTRATIVTFAQLAEPRPIDEMPNLVSWFRSAAGRRAAEADQLAEEYGWWCKFRSPPYADHHQRMIAEKAAENRSRESLIRDRMARGVDPGPGEAEWLKWREARVAHVRGLMQGTGNAPGGDQ